MLRRRYCETNYEIDAYLGPTHFKMVLQHRLKWLLINTWLTLSRRVITICAVCVKFVLWLTLLWLTLLPSWSARFSHLDSTTAMQCYTEPRAKMPTVYSTSRIHLHELCAMLHSAVRLNRFVTRYITCRSNNEFSTRMLWWHTRFDFINNHSIYVNSSTTTCLLDLCGLQTMLY